MGVPKFFRYISERYPCLSELVRQEQMPDFDNLYLDMNGIIHTCTHPDDKDIHFRMTEQKMFEAIFNYISTLFRMIKPCKLFFMAVDGVAPRAKMNQQRGRRFRAAKVVEELLKKCETNNEQISNEERFDSNCITPGTEFMVRLQVALQEYIQKKMSIDPLWQKCRIILSGHQVPGEGEHKIMDYIRYLRSNPDYNPNTRHCLYGLDADLIMLGICTHEQHFSLLREEVKFSINKDKPSAAGETKFFLLHLGLLREYLELEFQAVKNQLTKPHFQFDIDKILDDWLLMGFLVGNDFIPHLPCMHIGKNALPLLYKVYMKVLPTLDGYINESGTLNLERFEIFMHELALLDMELFQQQHIGSLKGLEAFEDSNSDMEMELDMKELIQQSENMMLNYQLNNLGETNELFNDDDDVNVKEFKINKRDYYKSKLKYEEMTTDVLAEQTECYIRAIVWNLAYYYHGCISWSWYYPHHYAPFTSDITNFRNLKLHFEMGTPFLPYQQLLAVLPAASVKLLPKAYHPLMLNQGSTIIDYYPLQFETDLNGKKQDWEALVLIPFIDENRLLDAMKSCEKNLTQNEQKRNRHGPMIQYEYCLGNENLDESCSDGGNGIITETQINREEILIPVYKLVFGPLKNTLRDVHFSGFPTMKYLQYTAKLDSIGVKVFDRPSENETILITVGKQPSDSHISNLVDTSKELLNKEIFVSWPHLILAKVVAISNEHTRIDSNGQILNNAPTFNAEKKLFLDHYYTRMGIKVTDVQYLVHVKVLIGVNTVTGSHGKMIVKKQWSDPITTYSDTIIVKDIITHCPSNTKYQNAYDIFKKRTKVFMLSKSHFGRLATVVNSSNIEKNSRIEVTIQQLPEPDFISINMNENSGSGNYVSAYVASSKLGIRSDSFNRITGTIFVNNTAKDVESTGMRSRNIGLQLKYPKKNQELIGYTKKVGFNYLYSQKAMDLIEEYRKQFPNVFEMLANKSIAYGDNYNTSHIPPHSDPEMNKNKLQSITEFLNKQAHTKAMKRKVGDTFLDEDIIKDIIASVELNNVHKAELITLPVPIHFVYKPGLNVGCIPPIENVVHSLFDRIVIVENNFPVPLGFKGTIVGKSVIQDFNPVRLECKQAEETLYMVCFDKPFFGGNSLFDFQRNQFYEVPNYAFINITFGLGQNRNNNNKEQLKNEKEKTDEIWNLLKAKGALVVPFKEPVPMLNRSVVIGNDNKATASQMPTFISPSSLSTFSSSSAAERTPDQPSEILKKFLKINVNEEHFDSNNESHSNTQGIQQSNSNKLKTMLFWNSQTIEQQPHNVQQQQHNLQKHHEQQHQNQPQQHHHQPQQHHHQPQQHHHQPQQRHHQPQQQVRRNQQHQPQIQQESVKSNFGYYQHQQQQHLNMYHQQHVQKTIFEQGQRQQLMKQQENADHQLLNRRYAHQPQRHQQHQQNQPMFSQNNSNAGNSGGVEAANLSSQSAFIPLQVTKTKSKVQKSLDAAKRNNEIDKESNKEDSTDNKLVNELSNPKQLNKQSGKVQQKGSRVAANFSMKPKV